MGSWIQLADASARAWLSRPGQGEGAGVLVLHPWWGLNAAVRSITNRLAEEGFVALAPDLYGGVVVDTVEDAEREADRFFSQNPETRRVSREAALAILTRGTFRLGDEVGEVGRGIGVVGFSMGASWALELAAAPPSSLVIAAVALFYGTGPRPGPGVLHVAVQGHYATDDPFEPDEGVNALEADLRRAGLTAEFHRYPNTRHWFMEPDRTDAYDPAAAALAWQRLIPFLHQKLDPTGS